jgi:outer membrane protein assembly factor BamA
VRLGGKVSMKSAGSDLTWSEPELFGTRTGLTVTGFVKEREEPSYTDVSQGVSTALSRRVFAHTQLRVGYSFENRDVRDADPSVVLDSQQQFRIGEVFAELVYDDRDSPLFPTSGQRHLVRYEYADEALGGQIALDRLVASASWHLPLFWDHWVLGFNAETGVVWNRQEQELPVQERFFNGGNDSVRSFREAKLGPRSASGDPIGGEYRNILSAELRFPIFRSLQGAVFADAGNVGVNVSDYGLSDLSWGLGAGLRLALPIGPLRFDGAINPDPKTGERQSTLHLSVGLPF